MRSGAVRTSLCILLAALVVAPVAMAADSGSATVDARWQKAVLAGDLEGVVGCYAKGARLWMPGAPVAHGADAIRASYQAFFAEYTVKSVALTETEYRTSGSLSSGWGRFTMTLAPKKGGADVTMTGRFTEVAARSKAKWVYIADHASADPAPAPAPAAKK